MHTFFGTLRKRIWGPFLESPANLPGPISVFGDTNVPQQQKSTFISLECKIVIYENIDQVPCLLSAKKHFKI